MRPGENRDGAAFPAYEVRLSETAEAEIDDAVLYLARFSARAAERWHAGLLEAVQSLSYLPRRCPLAPENSLFDREVRQLIYRRGRTAYRLLYAIFEATNDEPAFVQIMRVRHGAQRRLNDPPDADDSNAE